MAWAQVPVAGGGWQFLGPAPIQDSLDKIGAVGGNVTAVAFGPTGQIYAATGWGGVWESGDSGSTWAEISDTASAQFGAFTVQALAVAANGTIYAGTGSLSQPGLGAVGLLASSNGGATWSRLGQFTGDSVTAVDAGNSLNVVVSGPANGGVWYSADGGSTWNQVAAGTGSGYARLGAIEWASIGSSQGWSVDDWNSGLNSAATVASLSLLGGTVAAVELAASSHEVVALGLAANGGCVGLEVSGDGGSHWQSFGGGCPASDSSAGPAAIAFDAQGNLWLGGAGLWEYPAGASSWQVVTGVEGAVGALSPVPAGTGVSGTMIAGSQVGLWRQNCNSGCVWLNMTGNLAALQADSVAVTTPGAVWIGAAQGGVAGQPSWMTAVPSSAGAQVAAAPADPTNGDLLYAVLPNTAGLEISTNGGASFSATPFGSLGPSGGSAPLVVVNPSNAEQLAYAAGTQLWQSADGGASWAPSGAPAGAAITALAETAGAAGAPPAVVAGDGAGQVSLSGGAWTALPVTAAVTAVAMAGNTIFAAAGGDLFLSANGGGSWQTVTGIPAGEISALASDAADPQAIYAGMATSGVYGSADGGQTWSQLGTGLPGAPVMALTTDLALRQLIAATGGRGVWAWQLGKAAANVTLGGATAATVGSLVPLTATVANILGQPVSGATVNWAVNGGAVSASSTTNAQGQAAYTLTLPTLAGTITVGAWVTGSDQGQGTLTITAQAGGPAALSAVAGGGQNGIAGQPLPNPVVAEVTDSDGNPVAGVTVTFSDGGAGGSFTPANGQAVSGGDGRASIAYTMPAKVGAITLTAAAPNLAPAAFPETSLPPPDFTLSFTPPALTADVATTATFVLASTAVNGDSKIITLQCGEPATGCNITPGAISPGGTAAVSVAAGSLALGKNTVVVSGSDGVNTVQATAVVNVPSPDFNLTLTPSAPEANQDSAFNLTVAAQPVNGAYAQIALSCPQPVSGCAIAPAAIAPGQSATVTIAAGILAPGTAQVTVQGVDSTDQETHLATAQFTVVAAGMAMAVVPAALTFSAGGSGQVAVTVTPQGGLTGLVVLSCAGLPADATCSFSPAQASSSGAAIASTMVISTTGDSGGPPPPAGPFSGARWTLALWLLAVAGLAWGARIFAGAQWRRCRLAAAALGLMCLAGCGGGGNAPQNLDQGTRSGTPQGSYSIRVTAQSGKITAQTIINVTID